MTYKNGDVCLKSFPVPGTVTEDVPEESFFYLIEKKRFKLYPEELNGMGRNRKERLKEIPGNPATVTVTPDHRSFKSSYDVDWE